MQVRKIMTKNPACCTPDSTLQEVAHMMEMYDCGCIPVVESHQNGRAVGTITDRDIAVRTFAAEKNPLEMKASDIMTTQIVKLKPETSVEECFKAMENAQIRRVLIVDENDRCVGIVAQADLAEHVSDSRQTAEFVREISESHQPKSSYTSYSTSDRSPQDYSYEREVSNERMADERRSYQSFSERDRSSASRPRRLKNTREISFEKRSSFFSGKTLLTLLASVGVGAGIKYYLAPERENKHREFTGTQIKTHAVDVKTAPVKIESDTTTRTTTTATETDAFTPAHTTTTTSDRPATSSSTGGGIDSFNTTIDSGDSDLKPILEVGRTATNK